LGVVLGVGVVSPAEGAGDVGPVCFDRVIASTVGDKWKRVPIPKGMCVTQIAGAQEYASFLGLVNSDGEFAFASGSGEWVDKFRRVEADLSTKLPDGVGIAWARLYYGTYFVFTDGRASGCSWWKPEEKGAPCWTSSGVELPAGTRYTAMVGGRGPLYALLRSDGVIVLVDAVRAAAGEADVFTEVRAGPGRRFVKLVANGEYSEITALDSGGGVSRDHLDPGRRTGGGSMSTPDYTRGDGARYVDLVETGFPSEYLLRDDGVVVDDGWTSRRPVWSPAGLRVVGFGSDSYLPLAFTRDGSAFSVPYRGFGPSYGGDLVVPWVGPGWRIVDGAGTESTSLLGLVRADESVKRHPTAVYAAANTDGTPVALPLKGKGTVTLVLMGVGDTKGGEVVVRRKGKVVGRAVVAGNGRLVKVKVPVAGLPKKKTAKLTAQFLGTKTAKKSAVTTVRVQRGYWDK
jgi:hypothetical protein